MKETVISVIIGDILPHAVHQGKREMERRAKRMGKEVVE